jgi:nitrite reductase/ring-hydroxylating ferredoxin subunit
MPSQQLEIPRLQPAVRVADVSRFPAGTSRRVSWGDRLILVVHRTPGEYFAVQGTASSDGCLLLWDADAMRVVSPCSFVVYDLRGNVVAGLTTAPLAQYRVFEREAVVYVAEADHGS